MKTEKKSIKDPHPDLRKSDIRCPDAIAQVIRESAHIAALESIAFQIGRLADATELVARATAGEFDQEAEEPMTPTPKGKGMGMQG